MVTRLIQTPVHDDYAINRPQNSLNISHVQYATELQTFNLMHNYVNRLI